MPNFDWLADWRVSLNFFINIIVWGGIGCLTVWAASPAETGIKVILTGGLVPVLATAVGRFAKSPIDASIANDIKNGKETVERRTYGRRI